MSPIIEPLESPLDDVAHVPRRFGVGVMMILTTAFAVLFAFMRTFRAPPEIFIAVAGLFFAVTLAQILLFEGRKPRQASLLAGGIALPLLSFIISLVEENRSDGIGVVSWLAFSSLVMAPFGVLCGYLAGCVMAGVFFVQERLHRRNSEPVEIELVPLTATDYEKLCGWLDHRELFDLWSQGQFTYPVDSEQLEGRYVPAAAENPERMAYKAVAGPMQEMVASVELANIDLNRRRASVALAIVDPARNDRMELSNRLVQAVVRDAFERQGLRWLRVKLHRSAEQSQDCFNRQEFYSLDRFTTMPEDDRQYRTMIRRNHLRHSP